MNHHNLPASKMPPSFRKDLLWGRQHNKAIADSGTKIPRPPTENLDLAGQATLDSAEVHHAITFTPLTLTLTVAVTNIIREHIQDVETKSKILGDIIGEVQKTYNIREERQASLATIPVANNEIRILSGVKQIIDSCKNDLQKYKDKLLKLRDRPNSTLQT